jgi:putative Ca2+/H+ antiporter (TMEM165/GDT1 family)
MFVELIKAFGLIFIAEMGDKTQILAMAFATKYNIKKVLIGVFIGSLLNHALAVIIGSNLQYIIPLNTLSIIAGFSFILFGLWNLRMDDEEEKNKIGKYGPIVTVGLAFFIGELGDKTQLTAIALSTDAVYPLFVLMGTVLGMVFTSLIGIIAGIKLGSKIDEFYIKLVASAIFLLFGYIKLFDSLDPVYLNGMYVSIFSVVVLSINIFLLVPAIKIHHEKTSRFRRVAQQLQDYYSHMYEQLEDICLGLDVCKVCGGTNCLVGYTKEIIRNIKDNKPFEFDYILDDKMHKKWSRSRVLESLKETILLLKEDWNNESYLNIHKVRNVFEQIMYSKVILADDFETYLKELRIVDEKLYLMIR